MHACTPCGAHLHACMRTVWSSSPCMHAHRVEGHCWRAYTTLARMQRGYWLLGSCRWLLALATGRTVATGGRDEGFVHGMSHCH